MTPLYVSFFTENYRESAAELEKTLDAFSLDHYIVDATKLGNDWMKNVQFKPQFILNMMDIHPGRPLVWLDADARVRLRPTLFDQWAASPGTAPDFAAHWLDGLELLSGTLWFGTKTPAWGLAVMWRDAQKARRDIVDQVILQNLEPQRRCRTQKLPAEYVAIFDHAMCRQENWVISHHQYSRRFRHAG